MATASFSQGWDLSLWVCTCFFIPQVVPGVAWYCSSESLPASDGGETITVPKTGTNRGLPGAGSDAYIRWVLCNWGLQSKAWPLSMGKRLFCFAPRVGLILVVVDS